MYNNYFQVLNESPTQIRIHTTPTTEPVYNSSPTAGKWFSEDLLVAFSQADWSKVCLAHLFTAESFTDNRLGVAYIASSQAHINGGVCSPGNGHYCMYAIIIKGN